MRVIVLPGFSLGNKQWAQDMAAALGDKFDTVVHELKHWETGNEKDFDWNNEAEKVVGLGGGDEVNMLAKSIGTAISLLAVKKELKVKKLILCGIPLQVSDKDWPVLFSEVLARFSIHDVVVFQNENDPYGSYQQVKEFIDKARLGIGVISKPAANHVYPYSDDFLKFLL